MKKLELFNQIAEDLWENEIIDRNNYNYDLESFKKDFLPICLSTFDGITLLKGEIFDQGGNAALFTHKKGMISL